MRTLQILMLAGLTSAAWGQATVEYGLGAAAAGTAGGANARGIGGAFSNIGKALEATTKQAGAASVTTVPPAKPATSKVKTATAKPAAGAAAAEPAAPPKPTIVYEDPAGIQTGMEQTELLSRFGEPLMKITNAHGESLTYGANDKVYDVDVRAGKVYSVQMKSKPRQASVVMLQ